MDIGESHAPATSAIHFNTNLIFVVAINLFTATAAYVNPATK